MSYKVSQKYVKIESLQFLKVDFQVSRLVCLDRRKTENTRPTGTHLSHEKDPETK